MTQEVEELPEDLVRVLFELGGRTLVFVEGDDDECVFNAWFKERLPDVFFYPATGVSVVQKRLTQVKEKRPDVTAFGIRDRDFLSDGEVQAALNDSATRLFILTRYSVENYLLEPQALLDAMDDFLGVKNPVKNAAEVETKLLTLCRDLQALMAVNWLLIENGQAKIETGDNRNALEQFVNVVAQRLDCVPENARTQLEEKMALLQPNLETLETAHTRINGKYIFHRFYTFVTQTRTGLRKDHLLRILTRHIKDAGIPADIRYLVEKRILGDP